MLVQVWLKLMRESVSKCDVQNTNEKFKVAQ